jgi:16S rRNA (uracil1498-N3)-methyltransferase
MTRRRWIADEVAGNRAVLVGDHADHLVRVLRARVGQQFDIATGLTVRQGQITSVDKNRVEFELGEEVSFGNSLQITLALSIFKFDRMEWAIEKCTELGVSRIVPLIARRTDSRLVSASTKRIDRWQRIALQASEQSRRSFPPKIDMPVNLSEILNIKAPTRIVLAETEREIVLGDVMQDRFESTESAGRENDEIILAIGPEGGWSDEELQSFRQSGWTSVSLGNTILRAETAAISAVAIVTALR